MTRYRRVASRRASLALFTRFVNRPVSIDRFVVVLARLALVVPRAPEFLTETRARRVAVGRARRMRARAPAHVFDRAFYAKIAGVSFIVGAAFEGFMLATDFYPKVLAIEAERRREAAKTRDA